MPVTRPLPLRRHGAVRCYCSYVRYISELRADYTGACCCTYISLEHAFGDGSALHYLIMSGWVATYRVGNYLQHVFFSTLHMPSRVWPLYPFRHSLLR